MPTLSLALWAAFEAEHATERAGREFSRVPRPEREISEEDQAACDRLVAEHRSIALPLGHGRQPHRLASPYSTRLAPGTPTLVIAGRATL
jgi:hypothetical protein